MKLCILTFILVFLSGTAVLLALRMRPHRAFAPDRAGFPFAGRPVPASAAAEPPLKLPLAASASKAPEKSWEFSGSVSANFVSARGQLVSWIQNQGWHPETQITLDESISPRVILTFQKDGRELILMVWKLDTGSTGFAYRRDKINSSGDKT